MHRIRLNPNLSGKKLIVFRKDMFTVAVKKAPETAQMGPLINHDAQKNMENVIAESEKENLKILSGSRKMNIDQ